MRRQREVRLRLTAEDQARADALAARYGWTGFDLAAWALSWMADGLDVAVMLETTMTVNDLAGSVYHDPTHHPLPDGRPGYYTTVRLPRVAPGWEPTLLPPVPGKSSWTYVIGPETAVEGNARGSGL